MNRRYLYKFFVVIIWVPVCFGTLVDAPGKVFFAHNKNILEQWDLLSGELRFVLMRDMVLAHSEAIAGRFLKPLADDNIGGNEPIPRLAFSPDNKLFINNLNAGQWVTRPGSPERFQIQPNGIPTDVAWSSDGSQLAVPFYMIGDENHFLSLFEVAQDHADMVRSYILPTQPMHYDVKAPCAFLSKNKLVYKTLDFLNTLDLESGEIIHKRRISLEDKGMLQDALLSWHKEKKRLAFLRYKSFGGRGAALTVYQGDDLKIDSSMSINEDGFPCFIRWDKEDRVVIGWSTGKVIDVNPAKKKVTTRVTLPIAGLDVRSLAQSDDGRMTAAGCAHGTLKIWYDFGEELRKYFSKDIMLQVKKRDSEGNPSLTYAQAYAQLLMTALFFDLKQAGKALRIPDVVQKINGRAGKKITSVEELGKIRDTFPLPVRIALQKIFNISKL